MKEYTPGEFLELPDDHEFTKITYFPVIFMLRGEDQEDGTTKYHYDKKLMGSHQATTLPGAPIPSITFPLGNRVVGVEVFGFLPCGEYDEEPVAKFKFQRLLDMAMEELTVNNEAGVIVEYEKKALGSGEEE